MCNNTTHLIYTQSLSTQKGKTVTVKECVGTGEWLLSNQLILSGGARNVMQCNDYQYTRGAYPNTHGWLPKEQKEKRGRVYIVFCNDENESSIVGERLIIIIIL